MKIDLYIDFDGVILDTIDVASDIYFGDREHDGYPPRSFYEKLDWDKLLNKCHEINNSITNIKKLINSNLFNVKILTHVVCNNEKCAKTKYLESRLRDIEIITVDKNMNKSDAVDARGAVLVDDYSGNLDLWKKSLGIPIKFTNKDKDYEYIKINSLDKLIDIFPKLRFLVIEKSC